MSSIQWTQPTGSGLGDRLVDLILLLAYARVRGKSLCLEWPEFPAKSIDCAHRSTDILLENVRSYIHFPPDLHFGLDGDETFDQTIGGGASVETFFNGRMQGMCSLEEYKATVRGVTEDFRFCDEINQVVDAAPKSFVSFHIRRGDKVRDCLEHDGNFILQPELPRLNELTVLAMESFRDRFDDYFFCADENENNAPFVNLAQSWGKNVVRIPEMEKWRSTYYDIAMMCASAAIITSQRYSSFSRCAAMLGDVPIQTAYAFQ